MRRGNEQTPNERIDKEVQAIIRRGTDAQKTVNINFYGKGYKKDGFQYFSTKPELQKVTIRSINLTQNIITGQGCQILQKPIFLKLENIDLKENDIQSSGCQILSTIKWTNIKIFSIQSNKIGSEGLHSLFKSEWILGVKVLNLSNNQIEGDAMKLFGSHQFSRLEELNLNNNPLGTQAIQHFGTDSSFPKLRIFSLDNTNIGDQGCKMLKHIKMPVLQSLHLVDNSISGKGVCHLKEAKIDNLKLLNLANNPLGTEGCKQLKQANWTKLEWLCLDNCDLGDPALRWLSKANLPLLQQLRVSCNNRNNNARGYYTNQPRQEVQKVPSNNFQKQGCQYFSQSHFPKLKNLIFDFREVKGERLKCFLHGNFQNLENLKLFPRYQGYYNYNRNENSLESSQKWTQIFKAAFPKVEL